MMRLDLMGQADTVFRLLDPVSYLAARIHVPHRMLKDQIVGETFTGEPVDTPIKRAVHAFTSVSPIGIDNSIQLFREDVPFLYQYVPEGEGRLGKGGNLWQGLGGVNLRAESNPQVLSRWAGKIGYTADINQLEPYQRDRVEVALDAAHPDLLREATETAGRRQYEFAGRPTGQYGAASLQVADEEKARYEGLAEKIRVMPRNQTEVRKAIDEYFSIRSEFANKREGVRVGLGITFGEPRNINESALSGYYDLTQQAIDRFGIFDSTRYNELVASYMQTITPDQQAYIARNTNRKPLPPEILAFLSRFLPEQRARIAASESARIAEDRRVGAR